MGATTTDPRRGREKAEARSRQGDAGRRRLTVEPTFRATYNAITEAHRVVVVPRYFWVRWAPILGPVASALYMQLRLLCYHNPATGETRDRCWPRQSTLAKAVGVKDTKTLRRAIVQLETHGFVTRESVYRRTGEQSGGSGRSRRCADRYLVHFEIPLADGDRAAVPSEAGGVTDVDNSEGVGKISRYAAREFFPSRTSTRTRTFTNVENVPPQAPRGQDPERPPERGRTQGHPRLSPEELDERQSLAAFAGDQLAVMAGSWDGEAHPSAGFHRRIAMRLDACHVHEALAATRDAMDDARGLPHGRGASRPRPDPAAYFAGAVRRIAAREGIDLGVRWTRDGPSTRASPGPASGITLEARKEGTNGA